MIDWNIKINEKHWAYHIYALEIENFDGEMRLRLSYEEAIRNQLSSSTPMTAEKSLRERE